MIKLKTKSEIEVMVEGGSRLRKVVSELRPKIKVGVSTQYIDEEATRLIRKYGGEPSFKRVKNYDWATCLPINEQVVHTPPSKRILQNGDILTLDIGMYYQGFNTDYSDTFIVGELKDSKVRHFLEVGQSTLTKAIKAAKAGKHLGDISAVIEKNIYKNGYFILKQLTGHGIGRDLHEDPYIFGYLPTPIEKSPQIKPGLTIAIEVIYSMGSEEIAHEEGNLWSIVPADRSLSACFEHTIAVTESGTRILT